MRVYIEHTTNAGQLYTAGDSVAYHPPGSTYIDTEYGAVYRYVRNIKGSAVTAKLGFKYVLVPGGVTDNGMCIDELADAATNQTMAIPMGAFDDNEYGWVLVEGRSRDRCGLGATLTVGDGTLLKWHDVAASTTSVTTANAVAATCEETSASRSSAYLRLNPGPHPHST